MQEFETVLLSTERHVATIRLNRPETLNAFTRQMRRDLHQALLAVSKMPDIRVVVLGAEGRGFSSGADLNEGPEDGQSIDRQLLDEYLPIFTQISTMNQTVIAALPGVAAGVGAAVCMHCDLSVMADNANIVMAFTNIGLVPDGGATWNLLRNMGYQRAYAFIAEGGKLSAKECQALGLVNKLAPAEEVISTAQAWADQLSQRAPIALRQVKQLLRNAGTQTFVETFQAEANVQNTCMASADAAEAITAFIEKRQPVFRDQ